MWVGWGRRSAGGRRADGCGLCGARAVLGRVAVRTLDAGLVCFLESMPGWLPCCSGALRGLLPRFLGGCRVGVAAAPSVASLLYIGR